MADDMMGALGKSPWWSHGAEFDRNSDRRPEWGGDGPSIPKAAPLCPGTSPHSALKSSSPHSGSFLVPSHPLFPSKAHPMTPLSRKGSLASQ